ncbi:DUF2934 domain-containing protein [Shinella sp.]|uniref:DUF2934 domain-containing protein n=1 Tax=Shinella sp. TaxID=1870904 RepID=UPI003F6FD24E
MADFDDLVRTEAYLIWQSEGRPHGQDARHWEMAAERVRSRMPAKTVKTVAPVKPLPLQRVALLAHSKRKPQPAAETFRASA